MSAPFFVCERNPYRGSRRCAECLLPSARFEDIVRANLKAQRSDSISSSSSSSSSSASTSVPPSIPAPSSATPAPPTISSITIPHEAPLSSLETTSLFSGRSYPVPVTFEPRLVWPVSSCESETRPLPDHLLAPDDIDNAFHLPLFFPLLPPSLPSTSPSERRGVGRTTTLRCLRPRQRVLFNWRRRGREMNGCCSSSIFLRGLDIS